MFYVTRAVWPHLVRRRGVILLVGSTAGITTSRTNTRIAHTATKGAIVAMTRQVAAEGAPLGIRAVCISPGLGTPEDVAASAVFLESDAASYITGVNLVVDGGWSAVLTG